MWGGPRHKENKGRCNIGTKYFTESKSRESGELNVNFL